MNNILEMIKNEKVEWKKLGDVKEVKTVSAKKKYKKQEYLDKGLYPIIDQGQDFIAGYTNDGNFLFDENSYVVFGDHTESIKYVDFRFAQGADGIKVIKTCEEYINSKYLYHVLLNFYKITGDYKRHFSNLKELEIPIPSLETQDRIVKILDTMVDHFTQIEAELEARNKQYEYYRDKLLSEEYLNKLTKKFGGNVEWKKLYDIGIVSGAGVDKKINRGEESIILLNYMDIYKNSYINSSIPSMVVTAKENKIKECNVERGDIFITPSSETVEDIFMSAVVIEDIKNLVYSYHIMRIRLNNKNYITSCFLNYVFRAYEFRRKMFEKVYGNTRKTITKTEIENLEIPIPPIPVQEHIVSVLDNFNKIVTDINEGLPKEIELRKKQYEYYRERLLDFKRDDE